MPPKLCARAGRSLGFLRARLRASVNSPNRWTVSGRIWRPWRSNRDAVEPLAEEDSLLDVPGNSCVAKIIQAPELVGQAVQVAGHEVVRQQVFESHLVSRNGVEQLLQQRLGRHSVMRQVRSHHPRPDKGQGFVIGRTRVVVEVAKAGGGPGPLEGRLCQEVEEDAGRLGTVFENIDSGEQAEEVRAVAFDFQGLMGQVLGIVDLSELQQGLALGAAGPESQPEPGEQLPGCLIAISKEVLQKPAGMVEGKL